MSRDDWCEKNGESGDLKHGIEEPRGGKESCQGRMNGDS